MTKVGWGLLLVAVKKKIGLLGGSYNPVHNGHLVCADLAKRKLFLDKIYFVPAYISPFKTKHNTSSVPSEKRVEMLKLILKDDEEILDYELKNKEVSYTINTVKYLLEKNLYNIDIFLIIGSDNFNLFHKWFKYKELLSLVKLAVITRPNNFCNNKLVQDYIVIGESNFYSCSSEIRSLCKNNKSITGLVPSVVEEYIKNEKLYL